MQTIWGYACISELNPNIKTGATTTLTYLNRQAESTRGKYLIDKARLNLAGIESILKANALAGIGAYRMPDSFMPMADLGYYNIAEQFSDRLAKIGNIANIFNLSLSFHPSQFFVLNSTTPHVVDSAIKNFNIFAEILDLMQLDNHPVLLTHVGARNTYRTREAAVDAFCKNFERLSPSAQKYFAVENDQSAHSIDSCLDIHSKIGIPVVIDNCHYNYKPTDGLSLADATKLALSTWGNRIPKVHLSSELAGSPRHAHADYINPTDYDEFYSAIKSANVDRVIIMVEAKKKDKAIQQLWLDRPEK